jgi:Transposase DDE domain group 1
VQVNATPSLSHMEVVCDMPGLTSRAGSALLTGLADFIGLTDGLVRGLSVHSRKVRHEPSRVARDLAVMLADGGDCLSDLGALRDQGVLFGEVASDATANRCLERLDEGMLARVRVVRAFVKDRG